MPTPRYERSKFSLPEGRWQKDGKDWMLQSGPFRFLIFKGGDVERDAPGMERWFLLARDFRSGEQKIVDDTPAVSDDPTSLKVLAERMSREGALKGIAFAGIGFGPTRSHGSSFAELGALHISLVGARVRYTPLGAANPRLSPGTTGSVVSLTTGRRSAGLVYVQWDGRVGTVGIAPADLTQVRGRR